MNNNNKNIQRDSLSLTRSQLTILQQVTYCWSNIIYKQYSITHFQLAYKKLQVLLNQSYEKYSTTHSISDNGSAYWTTKIYKCCWIKIMKNIQQQTQFLTMGQLIELQKLWKIFSNTFPYQFPILTPPSLILIFVLYKEMSRFQNGRLRSHFTTWTWPETMAKHTWPEIAENWIRPKWP